jgi:hypothetical protein
MIRPSCRKGRTGPDLQHGSSEGLSRVEGVAHAFEDEHQQRLSMIAKVKKAVKASQGACRFCLRLPGQLAQRRVADERQAEAQEVQRRQRRWCR